MMIVDMREDSEYSAGHVEGAVNIPSAEFMAGVVPVPLQNVDRDEEIILYCHSGGRSEVARYILRQQGFTNVTNGRNQGRVEQLLSHQG